jgi:beta-galactosidase
MNNYIKEHILYGGDYNPDQWPEDEIDHDIRLLKTLNVNTVTLPVFSWAHLQPSEDEYNVRWLEDTVKKLNDKGIKIIMATPTGVPPAWMCKKYPDILSVDTWGRKRKFGGRINFCPNSPSFKKFSAGIAEKLAVVFKNNPDILLWHINNEYNNNYGNRCYCENCRKAFIEWLKKRYGTLENLNKSWYTHFWGHTFYTWDEIELPSYLTELFPGSRSHHDRTNFQVIALDYFRFNSDCIISCYKNEADRIKKHIPCALITTNIVWQEIPHLDCQKLADVVDIISWDNYPACDDPPHKAAFHHDVMRSLKNGKSFLLMEQTPNQTNWHDYNTVKRPGVMRLLSYQALARGSDSVLFFQVKQSKSACEKYHAALIPHAGHLDTRMGRELIQLGKELKAIGDTINEKRIHAEAALIIDWDSWNNVEYSVGPSVALRYLEKLYEWYAPFYYNNIPVDVVTPGSSLDTYKVVCAPLLNMAGKKEIDAISDYTKKGGVFITTYFSGVVDKNDQVYTGGGYPGAFRDILGIRVEEVDALPPGCTNTMKLNNNVTLAKKKYTCHLIFEVVHTLLAETVAFYKEDFYKNTPCITKNKYGEGTAWYFATQPDKNFLHDFVLYLQKEYGLTSHFTSSPGVEITCREGEGTSLYFLINHTDKKARVDLDGNHYKSILHDTYIRKKVLLNPKDIEILKLKNGNERI